MANITQEMRWYVASVLGPSSEDIVASLEDHALRGLIDNYYEGGFTAWEATIPPDLPLDRPTNSKFALNAQLREVMGRPFRLQVGEELVGFRVFSMLDDEKTYVDSSSDADNIFWHDCRVVVATRFTESHGEKILVETAQHVTMRTYDAEFGCTWRLNKGATIRVPVADFEVVRTAGQHARLWDVSRWMDQRQQDMMCSNPGDTSWLDPRNRAKSLTPMGNNARFIRSLDRIV